MLLFRSILKSEYCCLLRLPRLISNYAVDTTTLRLFATETTTTTTSSKIDWSSSSLTSSSLSTEHLKPHHHTPTFYHYFSAFIKENGFVPNIPSDLLHSYKQLLNEFEELYEIIINDDKQEDKDFHQLVQSESISLISQLLTLQQRILSQSVVDDRNVNECTLEVRAGVGGQEAVLFANELFRLYLKFIAFKGWDTRMNEEEFEQVSLEENTSLWSNTIEIIGEQCFKLLRHEAGVHRVQRVPKTERYGRIHTSTVTVSVIPVRQNLVVVKDSDLKFEMKTSSGAGGQNVNRNFTCVRCTHLPTGHVTESQETRFQYINKDIAIRKMNALLNQLEHARLEKEARKQKKLQVGIAARSDKIRTYNYPQNRITDHRLGGNSVGGGGGNFHNILGYMSGEECTKMVEMMEHLEQVRHRELIQQVHTAFEQEFIKQTKKSNIQKHK